MRRTTAGRILLGLINMTLIVVISTAVISAIPPAFNFTPGTLTGSTSPPNKYILSWSYSVTNDGFYRIDNLYVSLSVNDPDGNFLASNRTTPISIERGTTYVGVVELTLNQTYITANPGTYTVILVIHSEFAYGLIKFSLEVPSTISL